MVPSPFRTHAPSPPPPVLAGLMRLLAVASLAVLTASTGLSDVGDALARTERTMRRMMAEAGLPGGQLAIIAGERLVFSRGYGLAEVEAGRRVTQETAFRIASLAKPITAAAILDLVAEGHLRLETPAGRVLPDLFATAPAPLAAVTIRDLLRHSGGWDRTLGFDPIIHPQRLGASPAGERGCRPIAARALRLRPQFSPGSRYAYSNLGYCLLGLIVEAVSGQGYAKFAVERILAPAGAGSLYLGRARPAPGEAHYYEPCSAPPCQPVAAPYPIAVMAANGGWVGSAEAVARLIARPAPGQTFARPPYVPASATDYYGLGWRVWPKPGGGADLTHYGSMPGSFAVAIKTGDGLAIAALFNARPRDPWAAFLSLYRNLPPLARLLAKGAG